MANLDGPSASVLGPDALKFRDAIRVLVYEDIAVERVGYVESDARRSLEKYDFLFLRIGGLVCKQLKGLAAVLARLAAHF